MNREMEYVYMVYLLGNFSKAAQKLYVSQSALSAAIKKLETRLNTPLFERRTQPLTLTPAGEFYIQSIKKIMAVQEEIDHYFANLSGAKGTIIFGSSSFFCAHILPKLIIQFQKQYPTYNVELTESQAPSLKKNLEDGLVDFTLTAEYFENEEIHSVAYQEDHIVLAVPKHFLINQELSYYALSFEDIRSKRYLDQRFPPVSLSCFQKESFLLLKASNELYERALNMCKRQKFFPKIEMLLDQLLTAYYIANDGGGVTLIRDDLLCYVAPTNNLLFYKIDDPLSRRNLYISYRKKKVLSAAEQSFLDFISATLPPAGSASID